MSNRVFLTGSELRERGILPLLKYHDAILRNDSELTIAERERAMPDFG